MDKNGEMELLGIHQGQTLTYRNHLTLKETELGLTKTSWTWAPELLHRPKALTASVRI